jgi:hypothetical protein
LAFLIFPEKEVEVGVRIDRWAGWIKEKGGERGK